jgi:carboxymethylenebutenolidase
MLWSRFLILGLAVVCLSNTPSWAGEMVKFQGGQKEVGAYLARPKGDGPFRAVVVVHEWWGLTDWIKGNADRLAQKGYLALAVDLYQGKSTTDPGEAHELMRALDDSDALKDLKAAIAYLESRPDVVKEKPLATIGWCMGGKFSRLLAQSAKQIGPTIICYGSLSTDPEQVAKLRGKPVLGIFGATDRGIPVKQVNEFSNALAGQGSPISVRVFPQAGHGFMRPGGNQYSESAATEAWSEIEAFLGANLK